MFYVNRNLIHIALLGFNALPSSGAASKGTQFCGVWFLKKKTFEIALSIDLFYGKFKALCLSFHNCIFFNEDDNYAPVACLID